MKVVTHNVTFRVSVYTLSELGDETVAVCGVSSTRSRDLHSLCDLAREHRAENGDACHDEHPEVAQRPKGEAHREGEERARECGAERACEALEDTKGRC